MPSLPRIGALLAAACAAAAVLAPPAPAGAAVPGSTTTDDVVLYNRCQQHQVSYTVQIPPGTSFWSLRVALYDPNGNTSQGNVFTSAGDRPSGSLLFQFCGGERTGTWVVRATGFTQVLPLVQVPFALPDTAFQVRPTATRTSLTSRSRVHGRFQLLPRVRQQAPHGFVRANAIPVRLERRVAGRWQRVRGLTLTTVHGKAVAVVERAGTYRAVVPERDNHAASASRRLRVG